MRFLPVLTLLALVVFFAGAPASEARVEGDEVVRRAARALAAELPAGHDLRPLFPPSGLDADGPVEWRVRVVRPATSRRPSARVEALQGGRPLRAWTVSFEVLRLLDVLVAARDLARGELVGAQLFRVERRALRIGEEAVPAGGFPLRQSRMRRPLRSGQALGPHHLEEMPLVARGQLVTVTHSRGGVTLRMDARAVEPGYANQPLRVRLEDRRTLTVWLDAAGEAFMEAPAPCMAEGRS